jgi:hypothetical protein
MTSNFMLGSLLVFMFLVGGLCLVAYVGAGFSGVALPPRRACSRESSDLSMASDMWTGFAWGDLLQVHVSDAFVGFREW